MARRSNQPVAPRLAPDLPAAEPPALHDDLEVYRQTLRGDFSHQGAARLTIEESRVVGARFTGTTIEGVRLSDVVVERTDVSGADIDQAVLSRVEFRDCRMSGLLLPQALLRDVVFIECKLDGANFRMVDAERVRFEGVDLRGAEFSQVTMPGTRFHGSSLAELRGGESFKNIVVDSSQVLPLALGVFAALHIEVDDERQASAPGA